MHFLEKCNKIYNKSRTKLVKDYLIYIDMDTTCIIISSSVIGGLCMIIGINCCLYTNEPSNITPVIETITITREYYDALKTNIKNEHVSLPEYIEAVEPPPDYIGS